MYTKKIFVSRSFDESFKLGCEAEYEAISKAIKELRHENISLTKAESSSSTPEEESLKKIKEADLVIFLLGRRYGTIYDQANNLSYIHAEYRKAVKENKKKLIYLFPLNEKDTQYEYCKKFREEVENPENRGHSKFAKIEDIVKTHDIAKEITQLKRNDLEVSEKPSSDKIQAYCFFLETKIKEDIAKEFLEEKKPLNLYSSVPVKSTDYFPRDKYIAKIKTKLKENQIVSLFGMAGMGKTTLATVLGHDTDLKKEFKGGIYYLKLGQYPNLEEKQADLLVELQNNPSGASCEKRILEEFANRKALLILDDIWKAEDFLPFRITNQETLSKILITTRFESLLHLSTSEIKILELEPAESLAMLKQKLGQDFREKESELNSILEKMSQKCAGLPLAINAVARILAKEIDLNRWQKILQDFNSILDETPADEEYRTIFASFLLSVPYLDKETKNRYFSLSILSNSSFFDPETLDVYWGSISWKTLENLTEASLLSEQTKFKGQKTYILHDLQKTFIKEKTKEQDLTNYKKQFIQNYQKKYAPDWHKIPFYEQNNFYYNYLEICKDLNEQSLAKEISEDILYNNPDISLHFVKKTADFLELDLIKEAPKILNTNQNSRVVVLLLNDLEPPKQKTYAQNYLKEAALKAESSFITIECVKILGTEDEQVRTFAQNYLKEPALKDGNSHITIECIKILGTEDEQVRTFAQNYLKEPALKVESSFVIEKCIEILGTEDEQVRTFAQNYLKEPALKDGNSHITIECIKILGTEDEQVRTFAQNYLKEPVLKAESSFITIECVKILGTEDEQVRTFAQNYLKEAALKDKNGFITEKCIEILGTEDEQVRTFAQNYLKEAALKDKNGFITEKCIEILGTEDEQVRTFAQNYLKEPALKAESSFVTEKCVKILGTEDEQVRAFAQNYLKEAALKAKSSHITIECVKILGTEDEQVRAFALNYLKEAALKAKSSHITIECVKILGTEDEQVRTFALNYLKEPALKDKNGFVTKKCIEILGTDDELRKDFANGYLEKTIKQGFEGVNSDIIKQSFKEAGEELRKDFANGYLEKTIKQGFEGVNSKIITQCFKEVDKEQIKDFANGYLEKAIKQDFEAVNSLIITQCFKEVDEELRKDFMSGYLEKAIKQDFESVNSEIIAACFKEADKELRKDFANGYLEKAIKQDFESVNSLLITQCFKEVDKELRKDFANVYLEKAIKQGFEGVNSDIIIQSFKEADKELKKGFADKYLKKAIEQNFQGVDGLIIIQCFKEADEELRKDFANGYLEKAIKQDFESVNSEIIAACFKEVDKELRKDFANGYLEKAIKQDFEAVNKAITAESFKEVDKELRKDFANGYLEKAIKQDFEAVNSDIIKQCFKEADEELRKDFANGYLEKAIKQDFESVNSLIITQCFKEADEELRKDFINKYFLLDFDKIDENIIRVCFKFVEKNNQRAIDYAENYIKKENYNYIFTLNSCLAFFPEDNQIRKDFAEKELEKINSNIDYLSKEINTKTLIIHTEIDNYQLRKKVVFEQLKLEFEKFPSYSKKSFLLFNIKDFFNSNRSLINACLLVCEGQESIAEYSRKILQHWEKEIAFRHRERYYHIHIITALKHPLMEYHNIGIAKQILQKDNDELCKNIEDKDFYFISFRLDGAIQELLQKHILSCFKREVTIESNSILELLQDTEAIRKKFFEINPEYRTQVYAQVLNTLSYFHQIHNQQKEAISYKQEATNLAEKICEENPNEILIERQAQYKAELQELTNENTGKNATD